MIIETVKSLTNIVRNEVQITQYKTLVDEVSHKKYLEVEKFVITLYNNKGNLEDTHVHGTHVDKKV